MHPADDSAAPADPHAIATIVDDVVTAWHADHFHGLGLLLSADLTNRLTAAREDLRAKLKVALAAVED